MQDSKSHNSSESFPDVSVDYVWNACAVALTAGEGFPTRTSACCSVCHSSPGVTGSGGHVKAEADRRVDVASADLSLPQKRNLCASPRALAKWSLHNSCYLTRRKKAYFTLSFLVPFSTMMPDFIDSFCGI